MVRMVHAVYAYGYITRLRCRNIIYISANQTHSVVYIITAVGKKWTFIIIIILRAYSVVEKHFERRGFLLQSVTHNPERIGFNDERLKTDLLCV